MPTHTLTRRREPEGPSTINHAPSISPCVPRGAKEIDGSKCHDVRRAQALSDAQAAPSAVFEVLFSRASLLALFALGCTAHGRAMRVSLVGRCDGLVRVDAEAMRALEDAGLAENHGKMVHITEAGEALVRRLVLVARGGEMAPQRLEGRGDGEEKSPKGGKP